MQDAPNGFDTPMLGLDPADWLARLADIAEERGHFFNLGDRHYTTFVEGKPTLLVTFETMDDIQRRNDTGQPLGFELVRALEWSHLCVLSQNDTWFRDPAVYAYFDRLIDDGFFEEFDEVIFYGEGACGYAAAAFSVASPGAKVVALRPQATLDPRIAGWDTRFRHMRRTSFTDRYGYAPDMVDAARDVFVIFDPRQEMDAMHAALFTRPNTTHLRAPFTGAMLEDHFLNQQILFRILAQAATGKLTEDSFAKLWRTRRDYLPYLRNLRAHLEEHERLFLVALVCANVVNRMEAPKFLRRLEQLERAAMDGTWD